tara:strand:+ start:216 stop:509 length:294 start_codon:yes stop_codon:yes gene_type:complete
MSIKPTVKFGIMVKGDHLPLWQHNSIIKLLEIEGVKLELIIYDKNPGGLKHQIKNFLSWKTVSWFIFLFLKSKFSKPIRVLILKHYLMKFHQLIVQQ